MVISRVNNFQNFPKKCQAVRRKIASELITLWGILSSTGLGCLTDPILTINGIFQKFGNSRLLEEIRFVIIFFKFADWLKMAGIFKLLDDPIYS